MSEDFPKYSSVEVTGVVLAGGEGRRMGGLDKGLQPLLGRPMVDYALEALNSVCGQVLINANRNRANYEALGYQVIADEVGEFYGPLAGMASAMRAVETPYVLFVPCDSPLVTPDIGPRLWNGLHETASRIAVASDGQRHHPVFALMHSDLGDSAVRYLTSGERKIDRWFDEHAWTKVDCRDVAESFLNINRPDEREALEEKLRASSNRP